MNPKSVLFFDTHSFEKPYYKNTPFPIQFFDFHLNPTTVAAAPPAMAIVCFVNDVLNDEVLEILFKKGVRIIALRCAGFNNVSIKRAQELGIKVVRVPEYSPHAVAEHAVGLMLNLARKIHKSYHRIHDFNFSLDGLVGFNIFQKQIGVIGTGRIGKVFCQILKGFGSHVSAYDISPDLAWAQSVGVHYTDLETIWKNSDIISLHCPLTPESRHLVDEKIFEQLKPSCILVNTSRGALINTQSLITALKHKKIAGAGLDVYEEEENFFFRDLSNEILDDDTLTRLISFPNVLVTSHQGFLTHEALQKIASTTINHLNDFFSERK
ncbi:MAG: 2-hydroxyacid dehydrogenase [Bdellovibrionaceae bacterium]|nr:2-hydroxyacid dehydrogenase [Pseudobdellovibrionaceae bacterium]